MLIFVILFFWLLDHAGQMNFSSFEQDILSGTEWDFRIGVQADWGQDLEESGNGYETIDITVRND